MIPVLDQTRSFTLVAFISSSQCRSRIAGFCKSLTALKDVSMFFTVRSSAAYASQERISLFKPAQVLIEQEYGYLLYEY